MSEDGSRLEEDDANVTQPGLPPPLPDTAAVPAAVLPYATPAAAAPAPAYIWREGPLLIVPSRASLPRRCVKCNADVAGDPGAKRITQSFAWHHPALFLLLLINLIVYAVVAMCIQKKAVVEITLCSVHATRRFRWIFFTWASVAVGAVVLIGGIAGAVQYAKYNDMWPVWVILGGTLVMVVGGILGLILARPLTPKRIDGAYAWLKGADPAFLEIFPDARRY